MEQMASNCESVRQEVEAFKTTVPLVQALRNPGMRPRHWDQMRCVPGVYGCKHVLCKHACVSMFMLSATMITVVQ